MLTGECLLALQNRRRAPPAAETKDSERPPKSMTLAPFPLSFASCLAPPHRTESRRVLCCLLCCAELRSTHRSAPSAAAAAAVSAASAAAAAATDPSPLLSSSANVDNKHSASKAPVPDTALKTPNWRGRSQRRANTTIPNPTPAIGRWKTATKRTTISSPLSALHHASDLDRPRVNARAERDLNRRRRVLQHALTPKKRGRRRVWCLCCLMVMMRTTHV